MTVGIKYAEWGGVLVTVEKSGETWLSQANWLSHYSEGQRVILRGTVLLFTETRKDQSWEKVAGEETLMGDEDHQEGGRVQGWPDVSFKNMRIGLPWWRSGWESACQCRGHGFEPWSGKIPHAAEQLSPWATTTELAHLEPVLRNGRGHNSERPAHRDEEWPPLTATGESPCTETKTQHRQK